MLTARNRIIRFIVALFVALTNFWQIQLEICYSIVLLITTFYNRNYKEFGEPKKSRITDRCMKYEKLCQRGNGIESIESAMLSRLKARYKYLAELNDSKLPSKTLFLLLHVKHYLLLLCVFTVS